MLNLYYSNFDFLWCYKIHLCLIPWWAHLIFFIWNRVRILLIKSNQWDKKYISTKTNPSIHLTGRLTPLSNLVQVWGQGQDILQFLVSFKLDKSFWVYNNSRVKESYRFGVLITKYRIRNFFIGYPFLFFFIGTSSKRYASVGTN